MQFITSSLLSLLSVLLVSLVVEAQPLEKRLPNGPAGSRLVQFNPSTCQTSKTVPMFVNSAWSSDSSSPSSASHAFIVQHGLGRDVNVAWSDLYPVVGDSRVLVAPGFNLESDSSNPGKYQWYTPNKNLAWSQSNDWMGGNDAINAQCSTYDIWDSIIEALSDKSRFPHLTQLSIVGHSDGGAFVSRYSLLQDSSTPGGFQTSIVEANAPTHVYMTKSRPSSNINDQTAPGFNSWPYGLENMPRYVAQHMGNPRDTWARYVARDSTQLVGTADTYANYHFGDQSPSANAQGGTDRDQRNFAWWTYKVLLSGANINVSNMWGYKHLSSSVNSFNSAPFNHKLCIVPGVGHVASQMYASDCGRKALLGIESATGKNGINGKQVDNGVDASSSSTSTIQVTPIGATSVSAIPVAASTPSNVAQIIDHSNTLHQRPTESNSSIGFFASSNSILISILLIGQFAFFFL